VKLKNLFKLSLALMLSLGFAACSGDDDDNNSAVDSTFKVATESIKALKTGGEYSITVQSSVQPTFTPDASWVTVSEIQNSGSQKQVWTALLNVASNTTNEDRTAKIAIAANGSTGTVLLTQTAADGLLLSSSQIPTEVPQAGGTYSIVISANNSVSIKSNNNWISVSDVNTRAGMTEHNYNVTVEKNLGDKRSGSFTVSAGEKTLEVSVTQEELVITMTKTAVEIAKEIYAGWNIGNTLEAYNGSTPSETAWGNPKITEKLIQSIKAAGFNAVRLPCAWDGYIEDRSTYKIKSSWLDRVDEVVGWCVKNDMYVIVNIHWDNGWMENNCTADKKDENIKELNALWTQIATKLGGYGEFLLFAGANEPNASDATKMAVLKEYEQTFVDAVRATGGNNASRVLIVQGPDTNIDETVNLFGSMPTDIVKDRLMAEIHYYDPWQFCGMSQDESWGTMAFFWGDNMISNSSRNATWGDVTYMRGQFQKMKTMFVDNGIPVILGEYGAITDQSSHITDEAELKAHKQSRYDFNKICTREAKNYGLVPFMWDTGEGMDRTSGEIKSDVIIPAIMEGAKAGTYPY
jgi:aryl-phospho-beta-D-glucosidase BglC (GH1 family)